MKDDKKKVLERQLQTLDREYGLGIFPELERGIIEKERFLIISYGGTGADALYHLKKNIYKSIKGNDIESSIRILAIDTDKNTQYEAVKKKGADGIERVENREKFTPKEFFWLDNKPARQAINLRDPGMDPWINPNLPAQIMANPTLLGGDGASSTRQIGRILLFPHQTVSALEIKMNQLIKELTDDNTDTLNIFIISGISGGTGSGIVVDTTYLIRYFISKMAGGIKARAKIAGFLLLPPTGTSTLPIDVEKGNRNGYAALKEIDHFMSIAFRGEEYNQQFGSAHVRIPENIFDTCYLIDGGMSEFVPGNPREKAKEVVSDCIVDMITSQPVSGTPDGMQMVASFMTDAAAFSRTMVEGQKEQVAPREANYVYCAIGHGKVLIPLELMKGYVAGKAFNEIYKLFRNCSNVTEADVDAFLNQILIKDYNEQAQIAQLNEQVDNAFRNVSRTAKKGGPFYTINLLNLAANACGQRYTELMNKHLVLNKEKKLDQLAFVKNMLGKKNEEIFTVYVEVMEQLKGYFKKEHDILCDSNKFESYTGTSYTFTPINLSVVDEKSAIVREFLDDLVSTKRVDELTAKLTAMLIAKRAEWTELIVPKETGKMPKFAGAKLIREFWETNIGVIVNATVEDYLIKYYSGDKEASYKVIQTAEGPVETEETKKWLTIAAKEIVNKMMGPAGIANPLAAIREDILTKENFNGKNFFLVPEAAPHLLKYIKDELDNSVQTKTKLIVASSFANDRISCYSQFTGLPAYMFTWTKDGEESYEKAISAANEGLHMSETKGGNLWRNYPNLLVESIWPKLCRPEYSNIREHLIGLSAKEVFDKANKLGLTKKTSLAVTADFGKYELYSLQNAYRPDAVYFKQVDAVMNETPEKLAAERELKEEIERKADELYQLYDWAELDELSPADLVRMLKNGERAIGFNHIDLQFTNTVLSAYRDYVTEKPLNWEENLAAKLLRTCPDNLYEMRGTVLVIEKLFEKVSEAQQEKNRIKTFARYLAAGVFTYNPDLLQWGYYEDNVEQVLADIDFGNKEMETAEYYFVFRKYLSDAKRIDAAVQEEYEQKTTGTDKADQIAKRKAIMANAEKMIAKINQTMNVDKNASDLSRVITSQIFRKGCSVRGYRADEIIDCYKALKEALQYI